MKKMQLRMYPGDSQDLLQPFDIPSTFQTPSRHSHRLSRQCYSEITDKNGSLQRQERMQQAQENVSFLLSKNKSLKEQVQNLKQNSEVKDQLIKSLTAQMDLLKSKYRNMKKKLADSEEAQVKSDQARFIFGKLDKSTDLNTLCQMYWKELRQAEKRDSLQKQEISKLAEENRELSAMAERARDELHRLSKLLEQTTNKLEAVIMECSCQTKIKRIRKQSQDISPKKVYFEESFNCQSIKMQKQSTPATIVSDELDLVDSMTSLDNRLSPIF